MILGKLLLRRQTLSQGIKTNIYIISWKVMSLDLDMHYRADLGIFKTINS